MNWSDRFSGFVFSILYFSPIHLWWRHQTEVVRVQVSRQCPPCPRPRPSQQTPRPHPRQPEYQTSAQTLPNCGHFGHCGQYGHYGQPVNVVSASLLLTTPPNSGFRSNAVNVIIIICVSNSWPRHSIFLLLTILWPIGEQLMFVELGAVPQCTVGV